MMMTQENIKERMNNCIQNPKILITYLWFAILIVASFYGLSAMVLATNNNGSGVTNSKSLGFAAIWMMLLVIALSIGGTLVMRKYQTPLAVGFFIGVVTMMSFNMFCMVVLFSGGAARAKEDVDGNGSVHSNEAAAVFAFILFVLYAVFAAVLIRFRTIIIKKTTTADLPKALELHTVTVPVASGPTTVAPPAPPVSV